MQSAGLVVLALSGALFAAALPLVVKKGDAYPQVDDKDMVVAPVGHSVGRGEVHQVQKNPAPAPAAVAAKNESSSSTSTTKAPPPVSEANGDKKQEATEFTPVVPGGPPKVNSGALLRSFYVFMGLGLIVIMYLVARSFRLNQKVSRVHKYGIIANREDMEMAPLEAEDEEDDVVFELPNNS